MFTNKFILVENRLVPFWVSDYGACILIHFKIALGYINPIRIFTRLEKLMRFEIFFKNDILFSEITNRNLREENHSNQQKRYVLSFYYFFILTSKIHLETDIAQLIPF